MSATERARKIRQNAEITRAERQADRLAEAEQRRVKATANAEKYREQHYQVFVGDAESYVGVSPAPNGGIQLDFVEWTTTESSVEMSREDALTLLTGIQQILGEVPLEDLTLAEQLEN